MTTAIVEVPGYVDRSGRVLRAPVVTVYRDDTKAAIAAVAAIAPLRRGTTSDGPSRPERFPVLTVRSVAVGSTSPLR